MLLIFLVIAFAMMVAPNVLDVFKADAFSMSSLTDAVNQIPFVPGKAGRLGIFKESGVSTTSIQVEEQAGSLSLIPKRERGAPPNQNKHGRRTVRNFNIPHLPLEDQVLASEVQNVRSFGGTQLQGVQEVVNSRMAEMVNKHDATVEYGRIGALKGVIYDADGSTVIYDLFTEFGLSQTSVDFVLGTAGTNVKGKVHTVKRAVETVLGQLTYQRMHVFAGKDWFDKFVAHAEVKAAYERWQDGLFLRSDQRDGFEFAGVTFEEYRGSIGGVAFVPDAEAYAFPTGVAGLFRTVYAPADTMAAANTPGLPRYAMLERMKYDKGVDVLTESNPLSYCVRPGVLVKLTTSN